LGPPSTLPQKTLSTYLHRVNTSVFVSVPKRSNMARPGSLKRSAPTHATGKGLSEREQHVLRERLIEQASREMPTDLLGGPLYRVAVVVGMAVAFGAGIWRASDEASAFEFFAAYMLELCMSSNNLVAIYMIFRYFKVPPTHQEYVLWWGLAGAVVLRGSCIFAGGIAVLMLKEAILGFSVLVIYLGFRLTLLGTPSLPADQDLADNSIVKFAQTVIPVTDYYDGIKFFSRTNTGGVAATPLFVVLVCVELTDFVFAIDNVPALFDIAERGDVFIVYMATLFGLLGLRSAYTVLSIALPNMSYLQRATGLVLVFIGARAIFDYFGIMLPTAASLLGISMILIAAGFVSVGTASWTDHVPIVDVEPAPERAPQPAMHSTVVDMQSIAAGMPGLTGHGGHGSMPAAGPSTLPSAGRSVAADLIGNALGETSGGSGSAATHIAFKMTRQD